MMKLSVSLNPVLVKELRGRMRGARAYLILTATLVLLGLVSYGFYRIARFTTQSYGGQQSAFVGQNLFVGLVFFALGVICFITPALTAGAISGEYERKTFDMLIATPLRPVSILLGKLIASLSYAFLLIMAAVPLVSLSFVFGGVATVDMIQALLLLLGYTVTFGVIGLFFSTLLRRTGLATVFSYIVLAIFIFGTLFVYGVVGVIRQQQPPSWILALNPFSAMASALMNPVALYAFGVSSIVQPMLWVIGGGGFEASWPTMPLWRYTVGAYAWLTLALLLASMILVRPVRRFHLSAPGWIGIGAFILASIVAAPIVYGPFTPGRIAAWIRWSLSPQQSLIVNGTFTSPLEPAWTIVSEVERVEESPGEAKLISTGQRAVVSISRQGTWHAETGINQVINRDVSTMGWLQLRVRLRVKSQDVLMCGVAGSECPVMIKLYYVAGGSRHYWMQGFYAAGNPAMSSTPPFCTTCEINQPHIQVPLEVWYTFESPNLMQDLPARGYPAPQVIDSLAVTAGGHSYEIEIAEVALLARRGRPPDWGWGSAFVPTPAPVMVEPVILLHEGPVVIERPPVIPPTPAPTMTPVAP